MNQIEIEPKLPRHYLLAWQAVKDLAIAVKEAGITDAQLREQAMKAAKSACLNCCEGASKKSQQDSRRAFGIARGESGEAAGAVETAVLLGYAAGGTDKHVNRLAAIAIKLLGGFGALSSQRRRRRR